MASDQCSVSVSNNRLCVEQVQGQPGLRAGTRCLQARPPAPFYASGIGAGARFRGSVSWDCSKLKTVTGSRLLLTPAQLTPLTPSSPPMSEGEDGLGQ